MTSVAGRDDNVTKVVLAGQIHIAAAREIEMPIAVIAASRRPPANFSEAEPGRPDLGMLHHYCHDISDERVLDRNRMTLRFALSPT